MSREINDLMLEYLQGRGALSSDLQDAWSEFLTLEGVGEGSVNSRQLEWLLSEGATSRNYNDAWHSFLLGKGASKAPIESMKYEWLTGLAGMWSGSGVLLCGKTLFCDQVISCGGV